MKKVEVSIKCDACDTELRVDSPAPARYALVLDSANVGINTSGFQWANIVHPPLKESAHFCDFKCLAKWVNEKIPPPPERK